MATENEELCALQSRCNDAYDDLAQLLAYLAVLNKLAMGEHAIDLNGEDVYQLLHSVEVRVEGIQARLG